MKQTRQSCNSKREQQRGGLGTEPPAAGGKRGFGSSDAELIFTAFFQKIRILKHTFFLNVCLKCVFK